MSPALFGIFALIPMMSGPLPAKGEVMTVRICTDGEARTVEIPIPGRAPTLPEPCHPKGCHAGGTCRKSK